jgi:hypothetical protein
LRGRKISTEDLLIEALSLGLREDFLLALIQRLDLFDDVLDSLDERANAILPCPSCLLLVSRGQSSRRNSG